MKTRILLLLALCMPALLHAQGMLTAYYASEDFGDYRKGQLIVDTNDPINRMVDYSKTKYKYEGDDSGEYYSHLILKSQVTVKQYMMTQLLVEMVRDDATFVSRNGFKVRIFAACANGHSFFSFSDDGEFTLLYDEVETAAHQEYYVLSGQLESPYDEEGFFFEDPLKVVGGNIKLYVDGAEIPYASVDNPDDVRYRPYELGFLEEKWLAPEEYGYGKSAYDESGNLLVNPVANCDIPERLSIAYIGAEDALYINGTLYYRQ